MNIFHFHNTFQQPILRVSTKKSTAFTHKHKIPIISNPNTEKKRTDKINFHRTQTNTPIFPDPALFFTRTSRPRQINILWIFTKCRRETRAFRPRVRILILRNECEPNNKRRRCPEKDDACWFCASGSVLFRLLQVCITRAFLKYFLLI